MLLYWRSRRPSTSCGLSRREPSSTCRRRSLRGRPRTPGTCWPRSRARRRRTQIVLLSAHLDHLGVKDGKTYYGADDDASGTVGGDGTGASAGQRAKAEAHYRLWRCGAAKRQGLVGARYFLQNPTFPLKDIVANLEFEMIGRPDPKIKPDELWLTGWDRTNLGPELAQHGAKLVGDPHPAEKFFTRSDNYALAEQGIIAQTVSSFGLHADYHQPTDTRRQDRLRAHGPRDCVDDRAGDVAGQHRLHAGVGGRQETIGG